jgi:hypothetical protein
VSELGVQKKAWRGSSAAWAAMGATWVRQGMGEVRAGRGRDSVHVPLFDVRCSKFGQELGPTSYTKDLHEIVDYNFA